MTEHPSVTEFARRHMQAALDYAINGAKESLGAMIYGNCEQTKADSPLEVAFLAWFLAVATTCQYDQQIWIEIQPEIEVGGVNYRADFGLYHIDHLSQPGRLKKNCERFHIPFPQVAVELDGHDFHERTKEQVTYRNQRDRALQQSGWTVLHVSGSEFHRDPVTTIHSVAGTAISAFRDAEARALRAESDARTPEQKAAEMAMLDKLFGERKADA